MVIKMARRSPGNLKTTVVIIKDTFFFKARNNCPVEGLRSQTKPREFDPAEPGGFFYA